MGLELNINKSIVSDGVNYLKNIISSLTGSKDKMPEQPPSTPPAGSWGGILDEEFRAKQNNQMRMIDQGHNHIMTAKAQAESAELKQRTEALKKAQEDFQNQQAAYNEQLAKGGQVPPPPVMQQPQPPAPVYVPPPGPAHTITIVSDPSEVYGQEPFSVPTPLQSVPVPAPVEQPVAPRPAQRPPLQNSGNLNLKRRSPDFLAGQCILTNSQVQKFVDDGELSTGVMLEISRGLAELQYSIVTALINTESLDKR